MNTKHTAETAALVDALVSTLAFVERKGGRFQEELIASAKEALKNAPRCPLCGAAGAHADFCADKAA